MVPPCMRVQARGGCGPDESPVIDEEEKLMRQTCCRVTDEETSFFFFVTVSCRKHDIPPAWKQKPLNKSKMMFFFPLAASRPLCSCQLTCPNGYLCQRALHAEIPGSQTSLDQLNPCLQKPSDNNCGC